MRTRMSGDVGGAQRDVPTHQTSPHPKQFRVLKTQVHVFTRSGRARHETVSGAKADNCSEVPPGGLITSSSYDRNTFSVVRVSGECLGLVTLSPALSGHVVLDSGLSVANAETLAKYSEVQERAYERRGLRSLLIARTALSSEPQTEAKRPSAAGHRRPPRPARGRSSLHLLHAGLHLPLLLRLVDDLDAVVPRPSRPRRRRPLSPLPT